MTRFSPRALGAALLLASATLPAAAHAQRHITTPKESFGFNVGDDYKLATYTQFERYWRQLATETDRAKLVEIGKTEEGRPQLMMIVSSPANIAKLDRYKEISRRLALGLAKDSAEARALAKEGKAVVWIDGGLHATEVLGAHQLIETSYQLLSRNDPETLRLLDDDVILLTHVNPDGMELVSGWYMSQQDTLKRNMNIPRLYEKYAGHDDNRDFYMANLKETQNDNKQLYWEWFPQIVYNHHQTGPAGTVMFAPPFRDPFNYNYDPLVVMELDQVGSAMHARFESEGKPGVTMRSGSTYSTWWNGGLRTMPYFHNMVGLLTETIGNPTPTSIPFVPDQQLPRADLPFPIAPQPWHFRQSIDYSLTANWAVLDLASRNKENFLYNIWRMARNSIERGSRDTWTVTPSEIDSVKKLAAAANPNANNRPTGGPVGDALGSGRPAPVELYAKFLHDPAKRDPRGYIIPSDQPDFPTAVRFVNALRYGGVSVLQASAPFTVNGKSYPASSFIVKTAQPFRPHVMDMFEPQDHPNDFAYPGGPPKRPYDNAGYTLAYQMGVKFDRILDGFEVPNAKEIEGLATVPAAKVAATSGAGFLVSHAMNNAFLAVNRALKAGADVYMTRSAAKVGSKSYPAGTFWIASNRTTQAMMQDLARTQGVSYDAGARPGDAQKLKSMRIGLYDQYGGSMPSGWTRYLFEQYDFPYTLVYPKELDAGNLSAKFDVLVFPSGTIPGVGRAGRGGGEDFGGRTDTTIIPAELRAQLGRVSTERTVPQLRKFLEDGGTVIAVGTSTALGYHLGLPLENALVEASANGSRDLPAEKFYIPGSVLRAAVDTTRPVSYGIGTGGQVDVFYDNSPAFKLKSDAAAQGVRPLAWYPNASPLRSGWAWGQSYLNGAVQAAEARVGKGTLYLFAPEITFRGQPYGTFKWLFNGIYTPSAPNAAM